MEKFLMSSPIPLHQLLLPDHLRQPQMADQNQEYDGHHDLSPSGYEDLDFAADLPDFSMENNSFTNPALKSFSGLHHQSFAGSFSNSTSFSSTSLLAPFTMNPALTSSKLTSAASSNPRYNFAHLRNISLDDSTYRLLVSSKPSHSHSLSISSVLADPPSFPHSASTNTFQLIDLVPQLLLLISNQLLGESPYSTGAYSATPGRARIPSSISATNLYATPSRISAPSPGVKVGKTPIKGHRRTRLKVSESGSANLLAVIANMKNSASSTAISNALAYENDTTRDLNPFDTTLVSPHLPDYGAYDFTPLATPAKDYGLGPVNSLFFTPISQHHGFGDVLDAKNLKPSTSFSLSYNQSQSTPITRPRHDTLDSIKIEDQEDDACLQLRKAKSFTTMPDTKPRLKRATSVRNMQNTETSEHSPLLKDPPSLSFLNSASIDLLLSDLVTNGRTSALKSYPASKDLASITKSDPDEMSTLAHNTSGLLPPIHSGTGLQGISNNSSTFSSMTSTSSFSGVSSHSPFSATGSSGNLNYQSSYLLQTNSYGTRASSGISKTRSRTLLVSKVTTKTSVSTYHYPTASQIQEASTTEEIAQFAESILNSDMKRPIVVQDDSLDTYDPKKKHKCPLCFARFQRPEHVKRHLKSHSSEKPYQCEFPDCDRRFNRKDNLKAHLKKIHHQNI